MQEGGGLVTADGQGLPVYAAAVRFQVGEVWIVVRCGLGVDARPRRQIAHTPAHLLKHVKIDFGASLWAHTSAVAERHTGFENRVDYLRQFVDFCIAQSAS